MCHRPNSTRSHLSNTMFKICKFLSKYSRMYAKIYCIIQKDCQKLEEKKLTLIAYSERSKTETFQLKIL